MSRYVYYIEYKKYTKRVERSEVMRDWLKKKRLEEGKTQAEVAKKAGIARTTYAMIEQGERDPSVTVATKIAEALNFEWTLFFENKVHETRSKKRVAV